MEFRSQFQSIAVDPVQTILAEDEVYQRAEKLLDRFRDGYRLREPKGPLERVLYRDVVGFAREFEKATREAEGFKNSLAMKERDIARVREELSAVLDAWPVEVVEEAPPVTGLPPVEEAPRHYDRDGYCDNPARGY